MQRRSIRPSRDNNKRIDACFDVNRENSKSPSYWKNYNREQELVQIKEEKKEKQTVKQ